MHVCMCMWLQVCAGPFSINSAEKCFSYTHLYIIRTHLLHAPTHTHTHTLIQASPYALIHPQTQKQKTKTKHFVVIS